MRILIHKQGEVYSYFLKDVSSFQKLIHPSKWVNNDSAFKNSEWNSEYDPMMKIHISRFFLYRSGMSVVGA